jgi:hypothetical protein
MPLEPWELWLQLTPIHQKLIVILIPSILFMMNVLLKLGFRLPIISAGGDLCLIAVSMTIVQTFSAMFAQTPQSIKFTQSLLLQTVCYLCLWILSLLLVSFLSEETVLEECEETLSKNSDTSKKHAAKEWLHNVLPKIPGTLLVLISYAFGLLAFYFAVGTIFGYTIQQGGMSGG